MALFASRSLHENNPPSDWSVEKIGSRWALVTADGTELESFRTKRAALEGQKDGFCARLYAKEARWYAGEAVPGWKPYEPPTCPECDAPLSHEGATCPNQRLSAHP